MGFDLIKALSVFKKLQGVLSLSAFQIAEGEGITEGPEWSSLKIQVRTEVLHKVLEVLKSEGMDLRVQSPSAAPSLSEAAPKAPLTNQK